MATEEVAPARAAHVAPPAPRRRGVNARPSAVACAVIAAWAGWLTALAAQGGRLRPGALLGIAAGEPIAAYARAADRHLTLVPSAQHYDGVYFYAIARDPLGLGVAHTLIDHPEWRYGHPLHGWLATVLALGRPAALPAAFLLLGLAGLAGAAWAASGLAVEFGRSPWLGLAVAACPGLLFAVTVDCSETVGAALVLSALLAWRQERWVIAGVLMALGCLDKEPYVVVPVGLLAVELLPRLLRAPRAGFWVGLRPRALAATAGPLLLAAWYCWMHGRLGQWPSAGGSVDLAPPVVGWLHTFGFGAALVDGDFYQNQLGDLVAPLLIAFAIVLISGCVAATRARTVFAAPLIGYALVVSCQTWRTLLYPHELLRVQAVPLLLAVLALACRPVRAGSAA